MSVSVITSRLSCSQFLLKQPRRQAALRKGKETLEAIVIDRVHEQMVPTVKHVEAAERY
jgi:hypothetical protein